MSWPAKRMRPLSAKSWPESCAISVVLPAPFGPITACNSPCGISKTTSSVATMPPKRLASFSTWSRASAMTHLRVGFCAILCGEHCADLAEHPVDAAARVQHSEQQHRPEDDLPIFGYAGQRLLQQQQRDGAEHRACDRAHAAEHHHDDEIARTRPIHHRGADEIGVVGEQRAREPAQRAGDDESGELVARG